MVAIAKLDLTESGGLYVPQPYPDELLYSLCARFQRHLGFRTSHEALHMLFGRRVMPSVAFQGHLGLLRWLFEGRWHLTTREAAWRLTLLPYYLAHVPLQEQDDYYRQLEQGTGDQLYLQLGLNGNTSRSAQALRYCPSCAREDEQVYGETYWRRTHQLPGVWACPEHGCLLLDAVTDAERSGDYVLQVAGRHTCPLPDTPDAAEPLLVEIARRSASFLKSSAPVSVPIAERLRKLNLAANRCDMPRIEQKFIGFYGDNLLKRLGSHFVPGQPANWLRALCQQRRRYVHPLRYLLVEIFLERCGRDIAQPGFGEGPWPCLNWLADHHQQRVVTRMQPLGKTKSGQAVGKFSCDCGFVFSAVTAGKDFPNKHRRIIKYGPLFEDQALALHKNGTSLRGIARKLGLDHASINRMLERLQSTEVPALQKRIEQDRREWLALIHEHQDWNIARLRRTTPNLYARLHHNDRAWLIQTNTPARSAATPPSPRIDWPALDREMAQEAVLVAALIRERFPPVRSSANAILGELQCQTFYSSKRHQLPRLEETLKRVSESQEAYSRRRLEPLMQHTLEHGTRRQLMHLLRMQQKLESGAVHE